MINNRKPFSVTAQYYDLIYKKKGYFQEVKTLDSIIRTLGTGSSRLLDVGCGTGRHAVEFARRGYDVTGIDKSKQMIALASKARGESCTWIHKDVVLYNPKRKFDVAVSLFHVISYQTTNDSLVNFLTAINNTLRSGGLFIFDCWFGPGVFLHTPKNINNTFLKENVVITRNKKSVWDINNNLVRVYHTITVNKSKSGLHELHTMRYFFLPEIVFFLSSCGFRLIDWGRLSAPLIPMRQPQRSAWFVAKKVNYI